MSQGVSKFAFYLWEGCLDLEVRALVETGDHLRTQIAKATRNNHPFSGFDVECRAAVRRCGHASNEETRKTARGGGNLVEGGRLIGDRI